MELKAAKTTYTDLKIKRGYHQHGIEFGVGITIVNWQIAEGEITSNLVMLIWLIVAREIDILS